MTPKVARVLLRSLGVLLLTPAVAAQQPTFRTGVDLVYLDVVVLDPDRRPVTGLRRDDVLVFEDGRPRPVEVFVPFSLPPPVGTVGAAPTADVGRDVVSNDRTGEGRLVIVVFDRSIPSGPATISARAIARSAVEALGPDDLAAVVRTSGFGAEGTVQNFTNDRGRLIAALESPFTGMVTPPEMTFGGLQRRSADLFTTGDCPCGTCVFESLERVATSIRDEPGQKVMLWLGTSLAIEIRPSDPPMCLEPVTRGRTALLRALDRANVTVHAIDPTGLETWVAAAETMPGDQGRRPSAGDRLLRQGDIAVLPDYTGGRTVLDTNAPEAVVPDILAETRSYYLLGFARSADGASDDRKSLRVQVRRDGVTVRHRTGYYPAATGSSLRTEEGAAAAAVTRVRPRTDVPLSLALVPRFGPDGRPEVHWLLAIAGGTRDDYRMFDVSITVSRPDGRVIGTEALTVEAEPSPTAPDVLEARSVLPLPPGRYEVRAGVVDVVSTRIGSVFGHIDVEAPQRLTLSGILLHAAGAPDGAATEGPTARRTFARSESVRVSVQLYRADAAAESVPLEVRVVDASGTTVHQSTHVASGLSISGIAEVVAPLPLVTFAPGPHLLTVTVAHDASLRRAVAFAVSE